MKGNHWMALLATCATLSLSACGSGGGSDGGSGSSNTGTTQPAVTAAGEPTGDPTTTAVIGPAGGSLESFDKRLKIVVPPGAVSADTTFSAQPVTNTAPGGAGIAYRLLPEGVTFSSPVKLVYTYGDSDVAGSSPDALGALYHDADGTWVVQGDRVVDATNKTIGVSALHFSEQAMTVHLRIEPGTTTLHPGDQLALTLKMCPGVASVDDPDSTLDLASIIPPPQHSRVGPCLSLGSRVPITWTTNVGQVSGTYGEAVYSAPSSISEKTTYARVIAKATYSHGEIEIASAEIKITREILAYKGTFEASGTVTGESGTANWEATSGEFTLSRYVTDPGNNSSYSGVGNLSVTITYPGCPPATAIFSDVVATLAVYDLDGASPSAGKSFFRAMDTTTLSIKTGVKCGNPENKATLVVIFPGYLGIYDPYLVESYPAYGTNEKFVSGSVNLTAPGGKAQTKSTWDFTAVVD